MTSCLTITVAFGFVNIRAGYKTSPCTPPLAERQLKLLIDL
jgi:hypothetical protein